MIFSNTLKFEISAIVSLWLAGLIVYTISVIPSSQELPKSADQGLWQIGFFYTGQLLGELEPCGCGGTKRGGLLLRASHLNKLRGNNAEIVCLDGGLASPKTGRQSELKFLAHHAILQELRYDCQFVAAEEIIPGAVSQPGILLGIGKSQVPWYRVMQLNDSSRKLILLASAHGQPSRQEIQKILAQENPDLVVVMTSEKEEKIWELPLGSPCVVVIPVTATEPLTPKQYQDNRLVVSAGNRGRYAGLLQLKLNRNKLVSFESQMISLETGLPGDPRVAELFETYKDKLREERLLERQIKRSSPVGFVGSETCQECHVDEYRLWQTSSHAQAFATLVKERQQYDPECVGCHVVGYEFEEGFRTPEESDYLTHVGCEACHGPGARHATVPQAGYGKISGQEVCLVCHERDHSPHFDYPAYKEKIRHWAQR